MLPLNRLLEIASAFQPGDASTLRPRIQGYAKRERFLLCSAGSPFERLRDLSYRCFLTSKSLQFANIIFGPFAPFRRLWPSQLLNLVTGNDDLFGPSAIFKTDLQSAEASTGAASIGCPSCTSLRRHVQHNHFTKGRSSWPVLPPALKAPIPGPAGQGMTAAVATRNAMIRSFRSARPSCSWVLGRRNF